MLPNIDKVFLNQSYKPSAVFAQSSLVMPTCRLDATVDFFSKWSSSFKSFPKNIHLVFDGMADDIQSNQFESIKRIDNNIHIHSWDKRFIGEDIEESLLLKLPPTLIELEEKNIRCFSRKDSAIRSYGFLIASSYITATSQYKISPDDHVIYTLDDDCMPITDADGNCNFFELHNNNLLRFRPWASTVPGIRVRGIPYYSHSHYYHDSRNVLLSMGCWKGIPDFDGVQRLSLGEGSDNLELPLVPEAIMAHHDVLYPICGMNMAMKQSMIPAALFAPMGTASNYKRFDDIWFGLIAQAALRCAEKSWCYGQPLINHVRLSKPMDCLVAEAPGIRLNEYLWLFINEALDAYFRDKNKLLDINTEENNNIEKMMSSVDYVVKAMLYFKNMASNVANNPKEKYSLECLSYVELWCECLSNWLLLVKKYVLGDNSITF